MLQATHVRSRINSMTNTCSGGNVRHENLPADRGAEGPGLFFSVGLHRPVISALQEGKPDDQVTPVKEDTDLLAACMSDINT